VNTHFLKSDDSLPRSVKVSVVIPCFNQAHFLPRALTSLVEQHYSELQVIVVDDGSDVQIVLPSEDWPFQLVLHRQANQGLAAARNTGLQLAEGRLVKFLDADDILLPRCLSAQVASMSGDTNTVSVIGFVDYSLQTEEKRQIIPAFGDPLEALLLQNIAPVHSYLFFKQQLISLGGFCIETRTQGGCEDYDLLLRLAAAGAGFVSVHQLGVVYYRYTNSMSAQSANMQRTRAAVWSHTALQLLSNPVLLSASQASALLCGWWQLMCTTPPLYQSTLLQCRSLIIAALNSGTLQLVEAELTVLYQKFYKHPETFAVAEAIAGMALPEATQLHVPVQAIIDRRLLLLDFNQNFNEDWLCKAFTAARATSDRFAIYGSGDIGRRLGRIFSAAGLVPSCFIDKAAEPGSNLDGVKIITPAELSTMNLSLIIIASARFYREIKDNLLLSHKRVEIL